MSTEQAPEKEQRILIVTPVKEDALRMATLFRSQNLEVETCGPEDERPAGDLGTLLLVEEVLEAPIVLRLLAELERQPFWSDIPIILLTEGGVPRHAKLSNLPAQITGSVIFLERPASNVTLLHTVEAALTSRRRQYQIRDLLEDLQYHQGQLRESEERYRAFIANSSEGIWRIEFDPPGDITLPVETLIDLAYERGRVAECNEAMARMYGLSSPDDLIGKGLDFMMPPSPESREYFATIIRAGFRVTDLESVEQDAAGNVIHISNSMNGVVENGLFRRMWGTQRNITERKLAEAALQQSEQRHRMLFNSIDEGFCVIEVIFNAEGKAIDYRFLEVNAAFERQTGLVGAMGKSMRELAPRFEEHWFQTYGQVAKTGKAVRFQNYAEAMHRWFDVYAFRLEPAESRQVALLFNDITDRKRAEENLNRRASEQTALFQLTNKLQRAESEEESFAAALDAILTALPCQRASILLFDDEGIMQFVASRGLSEPYRKAVAGHSPWTIAERNPIPISIEDIETSDTPQVLKIVIKREGIRALAFIPLMAGGKLIGKFMGYCNTPHLFTQEEMDLALTIGRQLSFGLERQRAQEALRQSESRARQQLTELNAIYRAAPLGLAVLDKDLRYRRVNDRLAEINGTSSAKHIGKTIRDIVPSLTEQSERVLHQVLEKGTPVRSEFHGETLAQPGVERVWDERWYPLPNEAGEITGIGIVAEEITDRKKAEAGLLRQAEASAYRIAFADAIRSLTDPMQIQFEAARVLGEHLAVSRVHYSEIDPSGDYATIARDYNRGVSSQVGRHPLGGFTSLMKELGSGRTFISTALASDSRLTNEQKKGFESNAMAALVAVPLIKRDGLVAVLAVHSSVPRNWTPDEISLIEETADRTWAAVVRARAEVALRDSEERYRTLVEQIKDYAIFRMDTEGRATSWNEGVQRVFGFTESEFIGQQIPPLIFTPEDVQAGIPEKELRTAAAQETASDDRWLQRKDGSRFFATGVTTALRNEKGEHIGYSKVLRDETMAKQVKDALAEARRKLRGHAANLERTVAERTQDLRTANEQLEAFVYSIAHDLRAPLRSMSGFSQLLVDDYAPQLDQSAQHLLKRIQASSEFMDKLLLDLLAYGRMVRAEVEITPVPLQRVWESALYQCSPQIEQSKAEIETIEPLPAVHAHEATLGQCLANLLNNALKFVETGVRPRIRFWAEIRNGYVRAWVEDNGIGIPAEEQERAFRVFERLQGSRYPGTGIGLSIVKKGIERMGGRVGLESTPDKGSRFWIELARAD